MEAKLNKVVEMKLAERREYLDLIAETKELNYDLYLKMVQADDKRTAAYETTSLKKDIAIKKSEKLFLPEITKPAEPLRRAKSHRGRRTTLKKSNTFNEESPGIAIESETTVPQQDEEELALAWAFTILMKEFYRRNEFRDKFTSVKKKTNDKLEALWRFRKMKAIKKKEEKKKDKDKKKHEMLKTAALTQVAQSSKSTGKESKKGDTNNDGENESGGIKKRGSFKRKVQVVNLQDQIESKRKPQAEEVDTSHQQLIYKCTCAEFGFRLENNPFTP